MFGTVKFLEKNYFNINNRCRVFHLFWPCKNGLKKFKVLLSRKFYQRVQFFQTNVFFCFVAGPKNLRKFHGFIKLKFLSKHGVCSVTPEEEFKVVIYGNHLDKIHQIIWTFTNNCSEPAYVIDALNHFKVHFNHKATFHLTLKLLPEMVHAYKMCVKPKVAPGSPPLGEIYPVRCSSCFENKFWLEIWTSR